MTNSLRTLIPLACVLFSLLAYNFINAQVPTQNPPDGNVAAPINAGVTTQVKSGWLGLDRLQLFTSSPTIHFYDEDAGATKYFLHNNSNIFYLLADRNGDGSSWDTSPYPFQILASTTSAGDYAMFANNVRASGFCDRNGANCFAPSDVAALDTSNFINTGGTGQTKTGALTVNGNLTGGNLFTTGQVRTANVCDAAGSNCTTPANILDTTATGQTKAGALTVNGALYSPNSVRAPYVTANTQMRSGSYCNEAGTSCFTFNDAKGAVDATANINLIQRGRAIIPLPDGTPSIDSADVTFPITFASVPIVTVTPQWVRYTGDESSSIWVTNITTSGFTMNWKTPGGGTTLGNGGMQWIAIQ